MALNTGWPIIGWARTPVAPVGGALAACPPERTPALTVDTPCCPGMDAATHA